MESAEIEALTQAVMRRLFVPLEASGRHVHVTEKEAMTLFGHKLTPKRPLSQPGQFLSNERVAGVGPKGALHNVAVLGPERQEAPVETSLTDGPALGITPPVRMSGDVTGSPGVTLVGPIGQVDLKQGVIAAQRHIHVSPEDGTRLGLRDKQVVKLRTFTQRPVVFDDVVVRVHKDFATSVHLDYDEANACGFQNGDVGRLLT